MIRTLRFTLLLAFLGVLTACANSTPAAQNPPLGATAGGLPIAAPPSSAAPTTARPAAATVIAATALPSAEATAVPQPTASSAALPEGLTPEGYHYLGRADAPATLVMYSDFL
jgi:hypothetical protein